jgi:hypothetical protein
MVSKNVNPQVSLKVSSKLKCPFISSLTVAPNGQPGFVISGCIGADCMMYDSIRNQCEVTVIHNELFALNQMIKSIGDDVHLWTKAHD